MLTEWIENHDFAAFLKSPGECSPYPRCGDRAAWESIGEERKRENLEAAEKWLGFDWPGMKATSFMEFARSGDRLVYETPSFRRRWALADLTVGECIENEGRFLDEIINGIWCICEESFWGVPAHNWSPGYAGEVLPNIENPYIDLFAAETAGFLVWTKYLLEDKLDRVSHLIVQRIDIELRRRIIKPFLEHEDFFWMGYDARDTVNNWNAWIIANLTSVFLFTCQDPYERIRGLKKLMLCLDRFLDRYPEDGGCDEGTSYWLSAGGSLFDSLDMMYHATGGQMDFRGDRLVGEIGRFLYRSHIDGQYFINFADGAAKVNIDREMVFRYGEYIGDRKMQGLAHDIESDVHAVDIPRALRRRIPAIFSRDRMDACLYGFPYERDVWMRNIQVMAARQHQGSGRGLYLAAKGGHNGENHNHNDVGSCIIYLDGCPGIIDVGVGTYTRQTFDRERYSIWTMRSEYHNLPTVNGEVQEAGRDYGGSDVVYRSEDESVQFSMELAGAYPASAGIRSYRREYIFEREGGMSAVPEGSEGGTVCEETGGCIRIRDSFLFEREHNVVLWNLMCWKRPMIVQEGWIRIPVNGQKALKVIYPKECGVAMDHMETRDEKLFPVWGEDGVWRIVIEATVTGREWQIPVSICEE